MTIREKWRKNIAFLFDFRYRNSDGSIIKRTIRDKMGWVLVVWVFQVVYVTTLMGLMRLLDALFDGQSVWTKPFWIWEKIADVLLKTNFYDNLQTAVVGTLGGLLVSIFYACILAPWWETYAFQSHWLDKVLRKRDKEELCIPGEVLEKIGRLPIRGTVYFTSIIFGLIHGGPIHLLIQGVGGAFLCFAYLRTGRSFWSVVAVHSLYNATWIIFQYSGILKNALSALML